jgi:uncharacterized protein with HEPN domain
MSRHETDVRLRHMLDHAKEAVGMAQGKVRADLLIDTDRPLNLSLVRLLEIVGEAATRVPTEERKLYSDIPWPEVIGLRNRLIHGYDSVDFEPAAALPACRRSRRRQDRDGRSPHQGH